MAIWRPIQTGAAGFLSLMGLKNLGKNPDAIGDVVQPTIGMEGWWLRGSAQALFTSKTMAAATELWTPAGFNATDREWLYIHYITVSLSGAAGAADEGVHFTMTNGVQTLWTGELHFMQPLSGNDPLAIATLRDRWVPPGFRFGAFLYGQVGYGASLTGLLSSVQV